MLHDSGTAAFQTSWKMDLFDIKLRFGVSRIHFVRDKEKTIRVSGLVLLYRKSLLRADRLHANRVILSRKSGNMQCSKVFCSHVRSVIIIYVSFRPLIKRKICCLFHSWTVVQPFKKHVKRWHDRERWTMMSPMHATLKAGVMYFGKIV